MAHTNLPHRRALGFRVILTILNWAWVDSDVVIRDCMQIQVAIANESPARDSRHVRDFETSTCSQFMTVKLPRETEAGRAQTTGRPRAQSLYLFTYKWHALGDYMPSIRLFGGTDGISTQIVSSSPDYQCILLISFQGELAHRLVKGVYKLRSGFAV